MMRLRLQVFGCRRALFLTDTARPDCPNCRGAGGVAHDYGNPATGEYEGTDWEFCPCWTAWALPLLPLPHWLRLPRRGYSDEPPF